jgi:hypothetical protein
MKTFIFTVAIFVVFGFFISSSVGNVYAQSSMDIKKSDDTEHAKQPPKKKHKAASKSETKNIRPTTRSTLNPAEVMEYPNKAKSAHPGNEAVSGAPGAPSDKVDCCEAHTCCP